ncbi:MAG: hypothetical protein JWM04_1831 [Verrucomicrobiales bacterium]|jgi:hypothetical protein|nr:hypothetical protein [Verrucomicrobiales bacterium]
MVPTTGLEPVRCYSLEPESSASANSATWALPDNPTCKETGIKETKLLRLLLGQAASKNRKRVKFHSKAREHHATCVGITTVSLRLSITLHPFPSAKNLFQIKLRVGTSGANSFSNTVDTAIEIITVANRYPN